MLSKLASEAKSAYLTKIALFDGLKVVELTLLLPNQNMGAENDKIKDVKKRILRHISEHYNYVTLPKIAARNVNS